MDELIVCEEGIVATLRGGGLASATLVTKIMLGVFGNIPAFDSLFVRGAGIRWSGFKVRKTRKNALRKVHALYVENQSLIDGYRIPTTDFLTGEPTRRLYTRAKLLDMAGFIEGGV